MEFHEKLQELRKSRGMTQEELLRHYLYLELQFQNGNPEEDIRA